MISEDRNIIKIFTMYIKKLKPQNKHGQCEQLKNYSCFY